MYCPSSRPKPSRLIRASINVVWNGVRAGVSNPFSSCAIELLRILRSDGHRNRSHDAWKPSSVMIRACVCRTRRFTRACTSKGVENCAEGLPFPIPQNAYEVIWNHKLKYKGVAVQRWADEELRSLNGQIEFLLRQALARRGVKLPGPSNQDRAPSGEEGLPSSHDGD